MCLWQPTKRTRIARFNSGQIQTQAGLGPDWISVRMLRSSVSRKSRKVGLHCVASFLVICSTSPGSRAIARQSVGFSEQILPVVRSSAISIVSTWTGRKMLADSVMMMLLLHFALARLP